MPVLPPHARRALTAAPLALALVALGCGSDESTTTAASTSTPDASAFPASKGKSLADLEAEATESDLVAVPTVSVFEPGDNRYAFGLFTVSHEAISDADVALYAAPAKGQDEALGPFPAVSEDLKTPAAFAALTTTGDPDAATNVYRADVDLPENGDWRVLAMVREDDGSYSFSRVTAPTVVGGGDRVPDVGDRAPEISTPTAEDVGGDLSKIDTRQPPDSMHDVDYADVLGKEPIVLSFATPALCTSRVCGPVVDIAEEVKAERPDDATYIHMEIYTDNDVNKGVNEQVAEFGLPTEPWLFVIDEEGKIVARIEGAYSKAELEAALDEVA